MQGIKKIRHINVIYIEYLLYIDFFMIVQINGFRITEYILQVVYKSF